MQTHTSCSTSGVESILYLLEPSPGLVRAASAGARVAVAGDAVVAAASARAALVDVLEIPLGRDNVVALPDASAAVLALAKACDALAAVREACALLKWFGVASFDGRLEGNRHLIRSSALVGHGKASHQGDKREEDGEAHVGRR